MRHSLVILACAGFFLATLLNPGQAQVKTQTRVKTPTPVNPVKFPDFPDNPTPGDPKMGGHDNVPSPSQAQAGAWQTYTLGVVNAGMVDDRVWFRFGVQAQ